MATAIDHEAVQAEMKRQSAELDEALRAFEAAGDREVHVRPSALLCIEDAVERFRREATGAPRGGIRA